MKLFDMRSDPTHDNENGAHVRRSASLALPMPALRKAGFWDSGIASVAFMDRKSGACTDRVPTAGFRVHRGILGHFKICNLQILNSLAS
jgi:hypothetical protein